MTESEGFPELDKRLWPCPFCGCSEIHITETPEIYTDNVFFVAQCTDCGAKTGEMVQPNRTISVWNVRVK